MNPPQAPAAATGPSSWPTAPWRWSGDPGAVLFSGPALARACRAIDRPVHLLRSASGAIGAALEGKPDPDGPYELAGALPSIYPEWLGDRSFAERHGTRFPYVVGEMAHGIASPEMVVAAGRAGMLGFLGTAGLSPERVEAAARAVAAALDPQDLPWGVNLIHSPAEPALEMALADLYLALGAARVSASAFMSVTPAIVLLAARGLRSDGRGGVHRPRALFAKISRPETARLFMAPPPKAILSALMAEGRLSEEEATLAARLPIAEDVTGEADSGGHTDNRPLTALLPRLMALRDELSALHGYPMRVRLGAAGGIGTPQAAAAAFGLGADYVVTGSINQACVESGLSADARAMLAGVDVADTAMAASADMFELGVKVQVLRRGTLFPGRANLLHALYGEHDSLEALPASVRARLEKDIFRAPLDEVWADTRAFFERRDPREIAKAEADPKHRMALVFRWYLGRSVHWAIAGERSRRADYQIWCGPAMGAFNAWAAGSFLDDPAERDVAQVGRNILTGAAVALRAQALRMAGVALPASAFAYRPERLA
jgi:PfaD family protein